MRNQMVNDTPSPGGSSANSPADTEWFSAQNTPMNPNSGGLASSKAKTSDNFDQTMNMHAYYEAHDEEDYDNEPPLLEELGVNFTNIKDRVFAVLNPRQTMDSNLLDEHDLTGPLIFCLALGSLMLMSGKTAFGYIYGFSISCCLLLYGILNLMIDNEAIDFWLVCSVLGYCLIPVILLASIAILINLKSVLGLVLGLACVCWCSYSATKLFDVKLQLNENQQFFLILYPVSLIYSCFTLLTVM